jgi:ribosomal protein L7/L12
MRIRLYSAFASNNSGSYTLVGTFRDPAVAEEVAGLLREAIAAHDAWHDAHEWDEGGHAPIDDFVAAHGLTPGKHGRGDDWPCHGAAPEVVTSGYQVLVHAPYTVTCPTVFGELLYKKGGRVTVELDHAHERVCVEITYFPPGLSRDDPKHEAAIEAFEAAARAALPALIEPSEYDRRPRVEPVWHRGFWGNRQVSVVFRELVDGVRTIRALAREHGLETWLRVWEGAHGVDDPLAPLRTEHAAPGPYRVLLWSIGPDRVAAMKAARAALGCGLAEAKAALEDLPTELCVGVSKRHAEETVAALVAVGCDAEVAAPAG